MVIKINFSRELKLTVNIGLYWPVQPVYILPVSQTVQKDHWFVPPKLADYTALTSEYRPFRPVNLIRAGTKKEKKKEKKKEIEEEEKKAKTSHCHTTHHNVAVVSERYHVVEQLFPNCRCFIFFAFIFFFFLSSSSFFLTLHSSFFFFLYFLVLSAILNSEYWCE